MEDLDQEAITQFYRRGNYDNIGGALTPTAIFQALEEPFWDFKLAEPARSSSLNFKTFCQMSLKALDFTTGNGVKAKQDFSTRFAIYDKIRSGSALAFIMNDVEKIIMVKSGHGDQFTIPSFKLSGGPMAVTLQREILKITGIRMVGTMPRPLQGRFRQVGSEVYVIKLVKVKEEGQGGTDSRVSNMASEA